MSKLSIFTGRKIDKKFIIFPYQVDDVVTLDRKEALEFYKREFLKTSFSFLLFHPQVGDFENDDNLRKNIGYWWCSPEALSLNNDEVAAVHDLYQELKSKNDPDKVGYFSSGSWGNPNKTLGGDFLRKPQVLNQYIEYISKKDAYERIESDLSRRMALDGSGLCLPKNELGFLAPFQV